KAICVPVECDEDVVVKLPHSDAEVEGIELDVDCDVQVVDGDGDEAIHDVIVRKVDAAIAGGVAAGPLKIKMRHAGLPQFAWTTQPPNAGVAEWLVANVAGVPSAAQLRAAMTAVEMLPLADFKEMHPEADTDDNGAVSAAERDAFMAKEMKGVHKKILAQFPAADGNDDGELTESEMHEYFKSRAGGFWTTDGGEMKDRIICIDGSQADGTGTTQQKVRCKVIVKSAGDEEVFEPK
ncbi:MAG TPA: hypothetical protein VNT79_10225, partial [Phycisphaerae bacterium]|nr:hypothetical protein [Phycisphaerae bacterium]